MDSFFHLSERGSSVGTEARAGLTTFLAMAYIIIVNPNLLSQAGVPLEAAVTSTCVAAGLMTIFMGLFSNRPLACASGMGINAIFAFSLTATANGDWKVASAVILIEGLVITALVLCGLREAIMEAVPVSLRHAIAVGLGIFIAFLGLINGGVIVGDPSTLVAFGSVVTEEGLVNGKFIVGIVSILVTFILYVFNIKGFILWGILIAALIGIPLEQSVIPTGIVSMPDFSSFGAPFHAAADGSGMALIKVFLSPTLLVFVFSIMLSDFFDTMGTAVAVAKQGDFLDEDGNVKDIRKILIVDSIAAGFGGLVGASSCTTFVESASGAADGGRTGLTAVVAGILFLLASFFSPIIGIVCSAATCGALVMVGFLMMSVVVDIDWSNPLEGIPAFMTAIGIPLTYSIATGIGLGFITYVVIALCVGKVREVKPLTWIVVIAFLISFAV